uniref:Uncharacterized protein n=1 Tax=Auxenochlorella protothecoides TaxID=3075 RepID=A0A1D1ZW82_AUXPR
MPGRGCGGASKRARADCPALRSTRPPLCIHPAPSPAQPRRGLRYKAVRSGSSKGLGASASQQDLSQPAGSSAARLGGETEPAPQPRPESFSHSATGTPAPPTPATGSPPLALPLLPLGLPASLLATLCKRGDAPPPARAVSLQHAALA